MVAAVALLFSTTLEVPEPLVVKEFSVMLFPFKRKVPELVPFPKTTAFGVVLFNAPALPKATAPLLILSPPEKVLFAFKLSVPPVTVIPPV